MYELRSVYEGPSPADLSALVAAEHEGMLLLTGDGVLRRAAGDLSVKVHGTLWVLDRLVYNGALKKREAAQALTTMLDTGRRLPRLEAVKRIAQWKQ